MEIIKKFEFAPFEIRLRALLIDFVISVIILSSVIPTAVRLLINHDPEPTNVTFITLILLFSLGPPITQLLYRSIFESSKFQGTPGKIMLGIKVVDHNLEKIKFTQALYRNFIRMFSVLFFYIGFLSALGDGKCLTWHDKSAKTFVVRELKIFRAKGT